MVSNNNPLIKRSEDKLRLRCQAKIEEVDTAKTWVLADQERLKEMAVEMRAGNDHLFKENKIDIEDRHERLKTA